LRQYEDIDVGLKSNSYTVSGLSPGAAYDFALCLRRAEFLIPVSNAVFVTRGSAFQVSEVGRFNEESFHRLRGTFGSSTVLVSRPPNKIPWAANQTRTVIFFFPQENPPR